MKTISPKCKVCEQGELSLKKVYKLGRPVGVIGYIFLVPSILLFLFSLLLMVATPSALNQVQEDKKNRTRTQLQVLGVPNPLVAKVLEGERLSKAELTSLTPKQLSKITVVQSDFIIDQAAETPAKFAMGSVFLVLMLGSLIWGLIGFLLTIRKRVLQCDQCRATVDAN